MIVKVSDSNPIQFWKSGLKTYNESFIPFVTRNSSCFNQPIDISDDCNLDFLSDNNFFDYSLVGIFPDGSSFHTFPLTQIGSGLHYGVDFNWAAYPTSLTNLVKFIVRTTESFINGDFETGSLTPWYQIADGGVGSWVAGVVSGDKSAQLTFSPAGVSGTTKSSIAIRHTFPQLQKTAKHFFYKVITGVRTASSGSWSNANIVAVYYRGGVEVSTQTLVASAAASQVYQDSFITSETDFDVIGIRIVYHYTQTFGFVGSWRIDLCDLEPQFPESQDDFRSDFLSIMNEQNEGATVLVEYTNSYNYDDIDYESTGAVFKLRIPGLFWIEDEVTTQEDHQLSDGSFVSLRNDITTKRTLQVDFVPQYFHKKIRRVLSHDNNEITIETGERFGWKKMDEYIVAPLIRYSMNGANCVLTRKNNVLVNIGGDEGDSVIIEGKIYDFTYPPPYE